MTSMIDGPVILCVDDEKTGLAIRKMMLESQGYHVLTADNGIEGLAILSSQAIDLVVLDYKMPGMDGDVVAERMKQLKPFIPILMLSAYVDLPNETLAFVDRYLTKGVRTFAAAFDAVVALDFRCAGVIAAHHKSKEH